jgi:methyltransferase-like protein
MRPAEPSTDPFAPGEEVFAGEGGRSLTTGDVRLRALLHVLYDVWPWTLEFDAVIHVLAEASRRAHGDVPPQPVLVRMLQQALVAQLVSTHLLDLPIATAVPERPVVNPVARYQAARGDLATNLFHQSLDLDPLDRLVVCLLDGTRSRADVEAAIANALGEGRLAPTETGRPAEGDEQAKGPAELAALSLDRLLGSCYLLA